MSIHTCRACLPPAEETVVADTTPDVFPAALPANDPPTPYQWAVDLSARYDALLSAGFDDFNATRLVCEFVRSGQ